jgi:hypothetical protein
MEEKQKNFLKKIKNGNYKLFYKLYSKYAPSKCKIYLLELFDLLQYIAIAYNSKV